MPLASRATRTRNDYEHDTSEMFVQRREESGPAPGLAGPELGLLLREPGHSTQSSLRVEAMRQTQQTFGNRTAQRALKLQTKLTVNRPGDRLEQEADHIAEQVVNGEECSCGGTCDDCKNGEHAQRTVADGSGAPAVSAASSAPMVHTPTSGGETDMVPPLVHHVVESAGQPLDGTTRDFFESKLGFDFGTVRVHADDRASESASAINALAYTVGRDIVFASGAYDPATNDGRRLLAHELVHTIQQGEPEQSLVQRTCKTHSDEEFYKRAGNYCKDTGFTGMLHPGQRCYREVPRRSHYFQCPSGDQVCFEADGRCHDSFDRVSPVEKKNADGSCNLHHGCAWTGHVAADVIPGILEDSAKARGDDLVECLSHCDDLQGVRKDLCRMECHRDARYLP